MESVTVKGKKVSKDLRQDPLLARFCETELGNHPLSVSMVARALCGQGYEEAKAYIQSFVAMPTQQVDGNDPRYVRGMYGVMGLALARMECRLDDTEACEQSKALLCVLSVLPARGIPLELFDQMEQTNLVYCELFTPSGFNNARRGDIT